MRQLSMMDSTQAAGNLEMAAGEVYAEEVAMDPVWQQLIARSGFGCERLRGQWTD